MCVGVSGHLSSTTFFRVRSDIAVYNRKLHQSLTLAVGGPPFYFFFPDGLAQGLMGGQSQTACSLLLLYSALRDGGEMTSPYRACIKRLASTLSPDCGSFTAITKALVVDLERRHGCLSWAHKEGSLHR